MMMGSIRSCKRAYRPLELLQNLSATSKVSIGLVFNLLFLLLSLIELYLGFKESDDDEEEEEEELVIEDGEEEIK